MRPCCAANPQERIGASRGTRSERPGRGRSSCGRSPQSSESRMAVSSSHKGEPGASKTVPSISRTSPNDEREPISPQTSRQASTDVAFLAAQLTDSTLTLSTRKKGSGHPKGPRPELFSAFSAGGEWCSPSIRQASLPRKAYLWVLHLRDPRPWQLRVVAMPP